MSLDFQQRAEGPDTVKALAIVLVVFGHTLRGLMSANIVPEDGGWATVDRTIYLFHMPLFFFLSGIFLERSLRRRGLYSFIRNSISVLLGPLVIWSYLQLGLQYLASGSANTRLSLYDVAMAPFPPRQQFWFLWALFCIYAIAGPLLSFKRGKWWLGLAAFSLVALVSVADHVNLGFISYRKVDLPAFGPAALNFPFFALGVLLPSSWLSARRVSSAFCVAAFLAGIALFYFERQPTNLVFYVSAIVCGLSVYKLGLNVAESLSRAGFNPFARSARCFLVFLGMNTMIVYLAHVIFEAGFRAFMIKLGLKNVSLHLLGGTFTGMFFPLLLVPAGVFLAARLPFLATLALPARTPPRKPVLQTQKAV